MSGIVGATRSQASELPWRTTRSGPASSLPAWGMSASSAGIGAFPSSALPAIDRDWAWGGADGSHVRVCVLDSGIDAAHPMVGAVEGSVTVAEHADGSVGIEACPPQDLAGHGTACAGVIRSLAPKAALHSVRVLTNGKRGSAAALITGLTWAIDQGFEVINLSLATTLEAHYATLHELADRAFFRRCVLVASAHNRPIRSHPWDFSSVVSVASHDAEGFGGYFYNPAAPAEFCARGVRVPVAWPGGGTVVSTGNSFAAPHIAGICALILSKHPWLTPFQLKAVLYQCADNVVGREAGRDDPGHRA